MTSAESLSARIACRDEVRQQLSETKMSEQNLSGSTECFQERVA